MSTLKEVMDKLGITVTSEFVPYSRSRNAVKDAHPKDMSLNWKITLLRNGREVLTTDYTAGIGHCPSYKPGARWTIVYDETIRYECETGMHGVGFRQKILPKSEDVVWALVVESGVIDYANFEDWASEYGYNTDSRKAEVIYNECLRTALQLRARLGETGLNTLREAAQEY